ncbi:TRAP transporter small permease [Thermotoga sp.]|uniref:TRAP transporter small permease n=1 Tax=Thermotoga sp. TaxID=28240 RepID=UPI0025CDD132|nr:TRAP transporter small permease [Thermotoga sp.]MCD6552348.1 TRAP transporter small permease [Thermotoga sp.]
MRKWLLSIFKGVLDAVEIHMPSILLFAFTLSMFLQVLLRYVFKFPSPELYEITSYSFVWTVLLGAAYAHRYRDHLKFNIIYEKLPRKAQLVIDITFDSLITVLFIISLKPILKQAFWYHIIRTEVLGIPWTYLVLCLPVFMILVVYHNIVFIYYEIRELITGIPVNLEGKPWER